MSKKNKAISELSELPKVLKGRNMEDVFSQNVTSSNISDVCTECIQVFGTNKNIARHMPLNIDGLLPGERRVLYTMFADKKLLPDRKYLKLVSVLGAAAEYHPHGPQNLYVTSVKLAQYWNNTLNLIDIPSNVGTESGATASADRYLESKLTKYAYECFFRDFDADVVDMKLSYTGQSYEPEYLPAKYPQVLLKPTYGIGYGSFGSVPPYNFSEVCNFTIELIKDSSYDTVIYPDLPTGCDVLDDGQFLDISQTGKGNFRMRAVVELNHEKNEILIKNTPFKAKMTKIKKAIDDLHDKKVIVGLDDIHIHDGHNNSTLRLLFKKGTDLSKVIHILYKKTDLTKSYPIILNIVDDIVIRDYTPRTLLLDWISARRDIQRKSINKKIVKKNERIHLLNIIFLLMSKDNAEKTLKIIKKSENKKEIIEKLMKEYKITSLQAKYIADLPMSSLSKDSVRRYKEEHAKLTDEVEKLLKVVKSPKKIDKIIIKELEEGMVMFGSDRKSKIIAGDGKRIIPNTDHIVVVTKRGKIKKLNANVESIGATEPGDNPMAILNSNNRESVLLFDNHGKVFDLLIDDVMSVDPSSKGTDLRDIIEGFGSIVSIIPKPTKDSLTKLDVENISYLVVTSNGLVKKMKVSELFNIRKSTKFINMIDENDRVVDVKVLYGDKDFVVYTSEGNGVRLSTEDFRVMSKNAQGLSSISRQELNSEDGTNIKEVVQGINIIGKKDKYLFVLTNKGKAKKCVLSAFKVMKRNSIPLKLSSLDTNEAITTIVPARGDEVYKLFMKSNIGEIRLSEIDEMPRLAKSKKVIPVKAGDFIIDVKLIGRSK